jgi:hypothetical protein
MSRTSATRRLGAFAAALAVILVATALSGKVTDPKPTYRADDFPRERSCTDKVKAFPHDSHVGFTGGDCGGCHVLVTKENALPGETRGEIRRPDHAACLECHADQKGRASFFEKDPAKRTICLTCHVPRLGADKLPVPGSERAMTARPGQLNYSAPDQKPCDIEYGFDFSHAAHRGKGCDFCHKVLGEPADKTALMVSTPGHPECFGCHSDDADPRAAAAASPKKCRGCHSLKGEPDVATSYAEGGRDDFAQKFPHRKHLGIIEGKYSGEGEKRRCLRCHEGVDDSTRRSEGAAYPAKHKAMSNACFCCHNSDDPLAFGTSDCTKCHAKVAIPVAPSSHRPGACADW